MMARILADDAMIMMIYDDDYVYHNGGNVDYDNNYDDNHDNDDHGDGDDE